MSNLAESSNDNSLIDLLTFIYLMQHGQFSNNSDFHISDGTWSISPTALIPTDFHISDGTWSISPTTLILVDFHISDGTWSISPTTLITNDFYISDGTWSISPIMAYD